MEKTVRIGLLFEVYQSLLTDRQHDIVQMYYDEDFSLSEIGENLMISKQAVSDQLTRATKKLEDLEEKLQVLARHDRIVTALHQIADNLSDEQDLRIEESRMLIARLLEDLNAE